MNKNLHRIIFNARRGQRMVVAETASTSGKSTSADTCVGAGAGAGTAAQASSTSSFTLPPWALLVCSAALLGQNTAYAQIKADPKAPGSQQATVLVTSNGVPQVNIQTPNAAGVSRNLFSQFDVPANGAVLNNSRTGANTTVGGYVQANPWLAQGPARVILGEVTSSAPSQIQGPVEVAGQRAEVVIANPNGITVSGGSFINASGVTLTTGKPLLGVAGLEAYRIQGGTITVNGKGLDTGGADYTNVLARAVQVNAGIWAKDLRVVTGFNTLSATDPRVVTNDGVLSSQTSGIQQAPNDAANPKLAAHAADTSNPDATPGFALDVSALGGMYAGRIYLIGTERGLGVRNAGTLTANAGDLSLSNNGWLANSGSIYASANTRITTAGAQTHSGITAAQGNLTLTATGPTGSITTTTTSVVSSGLKPDGRVTGSTQTTLEASQTLTVAGTLASGGDLQASGAKLDISQAHLNADSATLRATGADGDLLTNNAQIAVKGSLTLSTPRTLRTDGATILAQDLHLAAHDLSNVGGSIAQGSTNDLVLSLSGDLDNSGGHISANGNVAINAHTITNARQGSIYSPGYLDINARSLANGGSLYSKSTTTLRIDTDLTNTGSGALIAAQGNTAVSAGNLFNGAGAQIVAGLLPDGTSVARTTGTSSDPTLSLTARDNLVNQGYLGSAGNASFKGYDIFLGGVVNVVGDANLQARSIGLTGSLLTGRNLGIDAQSQLQISGAAQVGGNASLAAASFGLSGQFSVSGALGLQAGTISTSTGSTLSVGQSATLSGGPSITLAGSTNVGNRLDLSASHITLTGPVNASLTAIKGDTIDFGQAPGAPLNWHGSLALDMTGDVTTAGALNVSGDTAIKSGGIIHIGGNAQSTSGLTLNAAGNVQVDGSITAQQGAAVTAGGTLTTGTVQGSGVSLDAQSIQVSGSVTGTGTTTSPTQLHATNGISITGSLTSAGTGEVVAITGGALDIGGATTSGAGLTLQSGTAIHLGQQAQAVGALHVTAGTDITADQGLAAGAMAIQAQRLSVAQDIKSGGVLSAQTTGINVAGNVLAGGDTQLSASTATGVHIGGALASNGTVTVQSAGALQVATTTQAAGTLQLTAQGITLGGKTTSTGNSVINAQTGDMVISGLVASGGSQSLMGNTITVQGAQALGQMTITATGGKIDSTGSILSNTGLTATATGPITVQGSIASNGATTLQSTGATGAISATGTIGAGTAGLQVESGTTITAANLQSLGDAALKSGSSVTLGNATALGSYTVTAGGNIAQAQVQAGTGLSETAGGTLTHTGATQVRGDVVLTSVGSQTLGSGSANGILATGALTARSSTGSIAVGGDLLANGTVATTATQGAITVGGSLATQGNVTAQALNSVSIGNNLQGNAVTLTSNAGAVQIAGNVQTLSNLGLAAQTAVQTGGTTQVGGTLAATSTTSSVAFAKDLDVAGATTVTAANGITLGGNSTLVGAVALQSQGGTVLNQGTLATNQTLTIAGNADLQNNGSMLSGGAMAITAHNISSAAAAGSTNAITTAGSFTATASGTTNLGAATTLTAKDSVTLASAGGTTNAGTIVAGNAIQYSGGTLANSGTVAATTVTSSASVGNTGTIYGDTVTVSGATTNSGQVVAASTLSLASTTNSGVVQGQTVSLASTSNSGSIAGNTVGISGSLSNQGSIGARADLTIEADTLDNTSSIAANNIYIGTTSITNSGQVHADGAMTLRADSIKNTAVVTPPPVCTPPTPCVPERLDLPYPVAGVLAADGVLTLNGGTLKNEGTIRSGQSMVMDLTGDVVNKKRAFLLSGQDITIKTDGSVTNDGNVYGLGGPPVNITIAAKGAFTNGDTGTLIAAKLLDITAASYTNTAPPASGGVGSLDKAKLTLTSAWDAGSNGLVANGLLTVDTPDITVAAGKTWQANNVKWNGTLTNQGTVILNQAAGTVVNQSTGTTTRTDTPNQGNLVGSYDYTATPPAGYSAATWVGYTDVLTRAKFAAGTFTGSVTNIAGDVSGTMTAVNYNAQNIAQTAVWSGAPDSAPTSAPVQILIGSASLARANFTGVSTVTLTSPTAGTLVGNTATITAADLTVDRSSTAAAQAGIVSASTLAVGAVQALPPGVSIWQTANLPSAVSLQNPALQPTAQSGAISPASLGSTVGNPSTLGSATAFVPGSGLSAAGTGAGASSSGVSVPAPDLGSAQGAWSSLLAGNVAPVLTDWAAINAQANAIHFDNLQLNLSGKLVNAGDISANSNLVIKTAGGIDNSGGKLSAGQWVNLDSQGVGLVNTGGVIQGGKLFANITGNVSNDRGTIAATAGDATVLASGDITAKGGRFASTGGDLVLDASGMLTLAGSSVSVKDGTAALYGADGVVITADKKDVTTTQTTGQLETRDHAAVAGGYERDAQAATTEVIGGAVTTTTNTQTEWEGGTVDAKQIDIRSSKGGVVLSAGALTANNGINIQAEKDVQIQAQRGVNNTSNSTDVTAQQLVKVDGDDWASRAVTTTNQGDTSNQETLRTSSLNAGTGALTISSNTGSITGQSAQLSGDSVKLSTGKLDENGKRQGWGSIDLESLQTKGTVVSGDQSLVTQTLTTTQGSITATNGITITASDNVILGAQAIDAGKGAVGVGAGGGILLGANADTRQTDQTSQTSSSSWFGLASSRTTTHNQTVTTTPTITTLKGQSVTVIAGDTLISQGATLDGKDGVYAGGKKDQYFYAVQSENKTTTDSKTSDSFLGIGYQDKSSTDSSLVSQALSSTLISDKKVTFGIGAKADLQGASVTAPKIAFTRTDPNGPEPELILGAASNTSTTSHTEKTTTLGVWQAKSGNGQTSQTLTQTTLNGQVSFDNGIKITTQLPEGDLKTQIGTLGDQGGLGYLTDLANQPNVKWDQVAKAHDNWSYSQQGLTPAGAALLAIAVAAYLPGASGLFGTTTAAGTTLGGVSLATTTATTAAVTTYTSAGLALNAGFTALASQAAVTFVNNGGDIGKTLAQLGSSESIKAIVATMLTAGALNELGSPAVANGQSGQGALQPSAKDGTAALCGADGVSITAAKKDVTTTTTTGQFQTLEIPAVAGGYERDAQAASTVVIGGSTTTTTTTQTEWEGGTVDAKQIDIRSSKGGVVLGAAQLNANNGINIQAEKDVSIQAQRGVNNTASSTDTVGQQLMGAGDNMELGYVTTTTAGGSSNPGNPAHQQPERRRRCPDHRLQHRQHQRAKRPALRPQSQLTTGVLDKDGKRQGGGSIDLQSLQSLQTQGSTVSGDQSRVAQDKTTTQGTISANNGITIIANQNVVLGAQDVDSGKGAVGVGAGGNILLGANADTRQTDQTSQSSSSSWLGLARSSTPTTTLKGQSVSVVADQTLISQDATLDGALRVLPLMKLPSNSPTNIEKEGCIV